MRECQKQKSEWWNSDRLRIRDWFSGSMKKERGWGKNIEGFLARNSCRASWHRLKRGTDPTLFKRSNPWDPIKRSPEDLPLRASNGEHTHTHTRALSLSLSGFFPRILPDSLQFRARMTTPYITPYTERPPIECDSCRILWRFPTPCPQQFPSSSSALNPDGILSERFFEWRRESIEAIDFLWVTDTLTHTHTHTHTYTHTPARS